MVNNINTKFRNHLVNWKNETKFLSDPNKIIGNKNFQSIISMDQEVIPYIIDDIENNPSTLVWAINLILGKKITDNPNTTITEACNLWVKKFKNDERFKKLEKINKMS